ncbi:ATP-binding protein [Brevundimonas subvibrioides]|uniref:histidine kinase n=1 Tax=Brevundimonas subvibrioides (strain ATCC 15264 / DSM 4735 / LMG 14903 / NBRC 16000 / CB 81) TaxID=633149 RepID=D9QFU8_BRESC|nr:ATP-binding protein [Brevundimonas subvibrioides]ADL00662.1 integral membrane sensor hybrid histidine kinase [Brevundimonas subvibrioides ATCC 15264]
MTTNGYAMIAQVRFRELKTRVGLALFIAGTAWFLTKGLWPIGWFAVVVVTQFIDWLVFRPTRLNTQMPLSRAYRVVMCLTTTLNVVVYSAISAYLWMTGGEAGRLFAIIQVAGGLLHVSLHMHHVRPLLLSAVVPHSLYFLGLPIMGAVLDGQPQDVLIAIGGVLYMTHLIVAVRQSSMTTRALQDANDEARAERRKAEVASAAKSDFLAVVSHEIRTPMNAVISAANLLRRTRLDREQREHVSMLLDAGDVLVGLLNDVLDFSKIEAGKMQLEAQDIDLRDKIGSLIRLWEPKASANGVRLKVLIDDAAPARIRTDPLRLQQMLFNLLSNAVKFTEDGTISIAVDWRAEDGRLIVSVADTGCGIPADRLAHIFDSFEQVDAGTTRKYGGTGLGLAISRRLAEIMGGRLTAESVEGEGSVFTLSLPVEVAEASVVEPKRRAMADDALAGKVILAADDHAVNRRILTLLLEPHGCRIVLVENGAEAVEAAAAQRFDAILMDMQMPVMDGLEASAQIRLHGLNRQTPLIALTANAMDVHRAAWDATGVHAFLTKPIDPVLLAETLAEACSGAVNDTVVQNVA